MLDIKAALQSQTIRAAVIAGLSPILAKIGVTLSDTDWTAFINDVATIVTVGASLWAIWGRSRATTRIGGIITPQPTKAPGSQN